jgi:hypothetical protein
MRAHGNEGRLGRRFLLAAGLIIALVVPSAAFGISFYPGEDGGTMDMEVKRVNGKNKRVEAMQFYQFRVNCPKSGPTTVQTDLDKPITGDIVRSEIAVDAKVQHRKWHFNELVRDAVGRSSAERIDATINFRGKFRRHNKDKADGTLEITLEGGATYLDVSGTERPIVNFEAEDCHGVQEFHVDGLHAQDR